MTEAVNRSLAAAYFCTHSDYLRIVLHQGHAWSQGDYATSVQRGTWRDGMALLVAAVARGIQSGVLRPGRPQVVARIIMATFQVVLAQWLDDGATATIDELIVELETLILPVVLAGV